MELLHAWAAPGRFWLRPACACRSMPGVLKATVALITEAAEVRAWAACRRMHGAGT